MRITTQIIRIVLDLIYFVFGLNGFFLFIPVPDQAPAGQAFLDAMRDTGYFIYLFKTVETLAGALLLTNRFTPLALVLLASITVNIFFYHLMIEPNGLPIGAVMLAAHLFLLYQHRTFYRPLLVAKTDI